MLYRDDTKLVINDILAELRQIRQLLEWDKADTLAVRANQAAEKEQAMADITQMNERLLLQAEARRREVHQQEARDYEAIQQRIKAEHEAQYHGKKDRRTPA